MLRAGYCTANKSFRREAILEGEITDEKNYTTPAHQAYQHMYWEHIKNGIVGGHNAYLADPTVDVGNKKVLLAYQNEESKKLFNAESENVKELVNKYRRLGKTIPPKKITETEGQYIAR